MSDLEHFLAWLVYSAALSARKRGRLPGALWHRGLVHLAKRLDAIPPAR